MQNADFEGQQFFDPALCARLNFGHPELYRRGEVPCSPPLVFLSNPGLVFGQILTNANNPELY